MKIIAFIFCLSCFACVSLDNLNSVDRKRTTEEFIAASISRDIKNIPIDSLPKCLKRNEGHFYLIPINPYDTIDVKKEALQNNGASKDFENYIEENNIYDCTAQIKYVIAQITASKKDKLVKLASNNNFLLRVDKACVDCKIGAVYLEDIFLDNKTNRRKISQLKEVELIEP
jgi:hypothetical protein